jgi:hypothetical protein
MLRLEYRRSYVWLFPIILVAFVLVLAVCESLGVREWAVLTLPTVLVLLLSCELRSGVALDSWWRASYLRGSWQYQAIVAWQLIGLVLSLALSYFFITA